MEIKKLYHGTNETQEFWESEDHEIVILRLLNEDHWTSHQNYCFLEGCTAYNANEALQAVNTKLGRQMRLALDKKWKRTGTKYALR